MIDAKKFRLYVRDNTPRGGDVPLLDEKLLQQEYVLRVGLAHLIHQAGFPDSDLTATMRLNVAAKLSAPEVRLNPKRWTEQFEVMAEQEGFPPLAIVWVLAADLCTFVRAGKDATEEEPLTIDGAEEGVVADRIVA